MEGPSGQDLCLDTNTIMNSNQKEFLKIIKDELNGFVNLSLTNNKLYSEPSLFIGNIFEDYQWMAETVDNTKFYNYDGLSSTYIHTYEESLIYIFGTIRANKKQQHCNNIQ